MPRFPQEHYDALDAYIDNLPDRKGSLIRVLHQAQEIFGYLPKEVQLHIARKLDIPGAKVFGVVSFYSYFTTEPVGKYKISVCMGTACFVRNADKVLDVLKEELSIGTGETTEDGLFTLKDVRCVGACGLAPLVLINDQIYGHVTVEDARKLVKKYRKDHRDDH
ncbi:NAD(P)H-dependent oxidoreductase subunit E [Anoxynatronum sibiricum]|uniref:NAD(P)H-dependent oxidoreductase subunit E n=1 Tax=Anoxynatronum sibiricum TaxID=210623 RepID=A0ABU9VP39_9CLOT